MAAESGMPHNLSAGAEAGGIDIHCHCLPGLDDGPETMAQSLELARALVADGINRVIATPHQLGFYDGVTNAGAIRKAVSGLKSALCQAEIPLTVVAGAEVRIDERIPALLEEGEVLTLAGTRYFLLELPRRVFIDPRALFPQLFKRGLRVIVAHPECYPHVAKNPQVVLPWLEKGAMLQVTAGSLCGSLGPEAEHAAWHFVSTGQASFVATDAHDATERRPQMQAAASAILQRFGRERALRLCRENPARVLSNQEVAAGEVYEGQRRNR